MKTKIFFLFLLISLLGLNEVKADTIYVSIPGPNVHYCQDTLDYDTFVFIKPLVLGSTVWKINGIIVSSDDTLFYTPTSVGNFQIRASWNGNLEQILLSLYSAPPAHAQFGVVGDGAINQTKDTVWMCGNSINIGAGVIGSEATFLQWRGPNGYSLSGTGSVTLTTPGIYTFTRTNACGITTDTFLLVKPPVELPTLSNIAFCNEAVSGSLDATPGFTYQWDTGENTQTLPITAPGTYTVTLTNACITGTRSVVVTHDEFPLPEITPYPDGICPGITVTLEAHPSFIYDSYYWMQNGSGMMHFYPILEYLSNPSTDNIGVRVTKGNCTAEAEQIIIVYYPYLKPEICIVSVNPDLTKNMVVWENHNQPDHFNTSKSHYNVYKWSGGQQYDSIGFVPIGTGQQNLFVDQSSNPPSISARYKIALVDACNSSSELSNFHQTILLSASQGNNPGEISLIWTPYVEEDGLFQVQQYQIWRGDSPDNMELYVQTPFTSYNDIGVFTQKFYQIVALKPGGCNPSPNKTLIAGSFSNISKNNITNIITENAHKIKIFQNPSSGIFQIEGQISSVEVFDNLGRLILSSTNTNTIDLTSFGQGIYHAKIQTTANGPAAVKLIVQ